MNKRIYEQKYFIYSTVHRQKYVWVAFTDSAFSRGFGDQYQQMIDFIKIHEFPKAFTIWKGLVNYMIDNNVYWKDMPLGYILQKCIEYAGYNTTFNNFLKNIGSSIPRKQLREVKIEDLEEKKEDVKPQSKYYGYNKSGEKVEAVFQILFDKKNNRQIPVLRDKKTGKFTKQSESFKQKMRERGFYKKK